MQKILSFALMLGLIHNLVFAQGELYISSGATIYTNGSSNLTLENTKLTNNGTFTANDGTVNLTGNASTASSVIGGTSINTNLKNLSINKSANDAQLNQNIQVAGNVTMSSGNLNLNTQTLDLGTTGAIQNEGNTHRIYGAGIIQIVSNLNAPSSVNVGNMGLTITSSQNMGSTTIQRTHPSLTVNGSTNILKAYSVVPTNNNSLNATARIDYFDNELNGINENNLQMWFYTTLWSSKPATTLNTTNNFIEYAGINNFKMLTAGTAILRLTNTLVSPPSYYCIGSTISVNYVAENLALNSGNVFTLQLSDASGSFASPIALGSLTSTATSGTITGMIPFNQAAGLGYRVRVVANNAPFIGSSNSSNFEIKISNATANITYAGGIIANQAAITLNPQTNVLITGCQGANVVLTANTTNANSFEWWKNGVSISGSQNQSTYTVNSGWGDFQLVAYDINGCGQAADTVGLNLKATPVANAGTDRNICPGTTTTIGTAAQASTTYTWTPSTHLSSASAANPTVLATLPTTTTYSLQITKAYTVLDANFTCSSANDDVLVTLKPQPAAPSITASATVVCQGTNISVTATNVVGTVKWFADNVAVSGANPLTVSSTLGVNKLYTAKNLDGSGCYSVPSNGVSLIVQNAPIPTITPSVGIDVSNVIKLCIGTTSTVLTANTTAGSPTYEWFNPTAPTNVLSSTNTLAVSGVTLTNTARYVKATYVYPDVTCVKQSVTKTIRQDATATGCRLMNDGAESSESAMVVYPNPTSNVLNVKVQVAQAGDATLNLVNSLGQQVWSEQRTFNEGMTELQLSLEHLPAGFYHLTLENGDMIQTVKVIKE